MSKNTYEKMMEYLRKERYEEFRYYDEVVNLGVSTMWKQLCDKVGSSDIDPTELFDTELEQLQNIKYSMQLMNICCLSETWEQDLYNFLKERDLIRINSNEYSKTKEAFEQTFPTCAISRYKNIEEMRALVNAIKHGEGNALTKIRRITADGILADSNIGVVDENGTQTKKKQIEFDSNTLTSKTLKTDGKLELYTDSIIEFWDDVYSADKERQESPEK